MKVIIQIPCFNEEDSLPVTLGKLPKSLPGISTLEYLIIDDGSTDRTIEVAKNLVHHIVRLPKNQGLARAFTAGLDACIQAGADIIVNTDADNQYEASDIPKLLEPILQGKAEFVIGTRPIMEIQDFSFVKKILQRIGSWVVRVASNTDIQDAPSGFRAMSRRAAMQLNVFSSYTYTVETIIQAGRKGISITSVPIRTNPEMRESRLVKSIPQYIYRSILTIIRIFIVYQPLRFFFRVGAFLFILGMMLGLRYLYYFFTIEAQGHLQSLILASLLMMMGFMTIVVGILSDLMSVNRKLSEKTLLKIMEVEEQIRSKS